jgi:hypothetical protein
LQYYDTEYRGVHCAARIPVDEIVLQVPLPLIMTSEVAKASTIGLCYFFHCIYSVVRLFN